MQKALGMQKSVFNNKEEMLTKFKQIIENPQVRNRVEGILGHTLDELDLHIVETNKLNHTEEQGGLLTEEELKGLFNEQEFLESFDFDLIDRKYGYRRTFSAKAK